MINVRSNKKLMVCAVAGAAFSTSGMLYGADPEPQDVEEGQQVIEEITVTGIRGSLQRSMDLKRDSAGVVDAITAEDIGKFPDENVAESLQRISGVAITRERGEGKFVSVRGLGPAFTPVTLNGRTITAGQTDLAAFTSFNPVAGRSFAFNVLPSSVVSGLSVYKSPSADLIEGGIGGVIDMKTIRPLDNPGRKINFSTQAVYEDKAEKTDPRISVGYTDSFSDDTVGFHISGAYSERSILEERLWHWGWVPMPIDDLADGRGDTDYDGVYSWNYTPSHVEGSFERTSVASTFQFQPHDRLNAVIDVLYSDYQSEINEHIFSPRAEDFPFTGDFPTDNPRGTNGWPFSAYDVSVDPSNGRLTHYSSYDPTGVGVPNPFTFTSRNEKNDLQTETVAIGANVEWRNERWAVAADVAYSRAESDWDMTWAGYEGDFFLTWDDSDVSKLMPDWDISRDPLDPTGDNSVVTDPTSWYLRGIWSRHTEVEDEEVSFKLDFDFEVDSGPFTTLEFGVRYADRTKSSVRYGCEDCYNPALYGEMGAQLGLRVDPNGFLNVGRAGLPTEQLVGGDFDFAKGGPSTWLVPDVDALVGIFEGVPNSAGDVKIVRGKDLPLQPFSGFDVAEESLALYVKQNFEIDGAVPISGNVGARVVRTENDTSGRSPTTDIIFENNQLISDGNPEVVSADRTYYEVLPSFMIKFDLTDELVARVGAGKSLTRPDLDKMGPNISVEPSNPPTGSGGNPELEPFTAWNYDFSLEWYFADASYLSAGAFYKEVDGFVQNISEQGVVKFGQQFSTFSQPQNVGTANIAGIELGYQQTFDFLPVPFNGLGVLMNYTYIENSTSFDDEFELSEVLEEAGFQGLSNNTYNAVLFYEDDRFSARFSYNKRSDYYTGFNIFSPRTAKEYGQLDASFSYRITDNFELTLEAVNLTQDNLEHYDNGEPDMRSLASQTGSKYFFGLRGSF